MAPQQTTIDPLTQLLTGTSGKDPVYEDLYNEENCLNLNIYMPESAAKNPDTRLPVLVFFHGGGLRTGGNGVRLYGKSATPMKLLSITCSTRRDIVLIPLSSCFRCCPFVCQILRTL